MDLAPVGPLVSAVRIAHRLVALKRAERRKRARGLTWVICDNAGTAPNWLKTSTVRGAYPYTDYTDKGNVIDAGEGDDWVSAGWGNDSVHGGDDKPSGADNNGSTRATRHAHILYVQPSAEVRGRRYA